MGKDMEWAIALAKALYCQLPEKIGRGTKEQGQFVKKNSLL